MGDLAPGKNQESPTPLKNLLMPLFLMGCFPVDFQEVKRPLRTKSVKRPIKVGKRPIKAKVLVGVSVGCLMGCFRAPPPWRKTAPLKRPIKRSKNHVMLSFSRFSLVAHDCGYPLSRYTCRATRVAADFLDFRAFCRCSTGVALHPPKHFGVAPPPPVCREVSHRNLGLKRCRATRGCRSYSCGCRATLCN